ncbi:O-methyltransferase-domain-containing protein [Gymnopilus junonius]|uniref:O-methyltransferase-domain-containing protein n=1 Tax=Gymnopilus junonius TaxID=109634 RepID=A0A9P5NL08_GYMJU|nr:O-methyltransferase-domain-containing protein [Gymnopilus junonius]
MLVQLSQSISEAVSVLQKCCTDEGLSHPNPDQNFSEESDSFRSNIEASKAADKIVAASSQLIALLQAPSLSLLRAACGHITSAALRVCLELSVVEILGDAGSDGLHVTKIAQRSGIVPDKLGRLLRYLSNQHIFSQVAPDTYANNRISTILHSKKSVKQLLESSDQKHDGSMEQSFPSLIELFASDLHLSSGYLTEYLKDPVMGNSEEPNHAPFNKAFQVDVSLFDWYNQPEQAARLRRFLTAMQGTDRLQADDGLLKAIEWAELPSGSIIVDVGGGWGNASLPVAVQNPHLRFVIQDKVDLVAAGQAAWETQLGQPVSSDRVSFQVHNFFASQPITGASIFILKHVLHAFSNSYAVKILKNLRAAAAPSSQLLIIDSIIPPFCSVQDNESPFLEYDPVAEMVYISDLTMMLQLNAKERTLSELEYILEISGWKVANIPPRHYNNLLTPVVAIPV